MTEQEWLECTDPQRMWNAVGISLSTRKLRLILCAHYRHLWKAIPSDEYRGAIEGAEQYVEGKIGRTELESVYRKAHDTHWGSNSPSASLNMPTRPYRFVALEPGPRKDVFAHAGFGSPGTPP